MGDADASAGFPDDSAPQLHGRGFLYSLSGWVATLGVATMLLLSVVTIVEILLRAVTGRSIAGLNEIVDAAMAVAIAASLAIGVSQRIHLKIEVFQALLPSAARAWLDALGSLALLGFFAVLSWQCVELAQVSISRMQVTSILSIPQAPIQLVVAGLISLSVVVQLAHVIADVSAALRETGRASVFTIIGICIGMSICAIFVWALWSGTVRPSGTGANIAVVAAILTLLIVASVPISVTLAFAGFCGIAFTLGGSSAASIFGGESYSHMTNSGLIVLPFFLLMGAFAGVSGLAADIYRLAFELLKPVRGGLAHATIIGCAGFGALTGSSLATVATFGKIALPEMDKRSYSKSLSTGAIAAGGTLGALIPPSVPLIIYGILVEASIGKLLLAAFVPAFIGVSLYLLAIGITARVKRDAVPMGEPIDWNNVRGATRGCWAALALFCVVWGGIYFGFFTDSEAASVGAVGTFVFALVRGRLRRDALLSVMSEVSLTLSMIFPLIFGAVTLSFFVAFTQVPNLFADFLLGADLTPIMIVILLVVSYIVLGTVMDSFAIMFITAPVYSFVILQLGYDPIWWGIVTVICVEIGVISPPFGLNLFVLRGVARDVRLSTIYRGVLPFCVADLVKVILLIAMPWLVFY